MVYRKPRYFIGQQDPGLPLKRRSQSLVDPGRCEFRQRYVNDYRAMKSPYADVHPRSPHTSPHYSYCLRESPYRTSRSPSYERRPSRSPNPRSGQKKTIWIDKKTGRVVDGPEILKGERIIRFENSTTTESDSSESNYYPRPPRSPVQRVQLVESVSRHRSPRRSSSRSPARNHSFSPRRRSPAAHRQYSPRRSNCSISSASSPSYVPSLPSSAYFQRSISDRSESTSSSSGYNSGGRRRYPRQPIRNFAPSPQFGSRNRRYSPRRMNSPVASKIITMGGRSGRSPIKHLVPHYHPCGQRQSYCPHRACHQRCEQCRRLESSSDDSLIPSSFQRRRPISVSRRSRATPGIPPAKPSSNLSFFEETILPGHHMPLNDYGPRHYVESVSHSDSEGTWAACGSINCGAGPWRNVIRRLGPMKPELPAHTRLNETLEKWLNDGRTV
uniref:Serine/arginine repetitive matrix protein 1 n=1 Tax=Mesocestoides corti TaxID=53468 RepID=A0A5K3FMC1_MESCO